MQGRLKLFPVRETLLQGGLPSNLDFRSNDLLSQRLNIFNPNYKLAYIRTLEKDASLVCSVLPADPPPTTIKSYADRSLSCVMGFPSGSLAEYCS